MLPPENRRLLEDLTKIPEYKITIISGRAVADVKEKVGIRDVIYVGNHGFEIEGPQIKFTSLMTPQLKEIFLQIKSHFDKELSPIKGVMMEDKGMTLAIHYRLMEEKNMASLRGAFERLTAPYLSKGEIQIREGKKVLEIRPPLAWDKGKAVLWLLARQKFIFTTDKIFSVCIGDDETDEDAFLALKDSGLSILVGKDRISHAEHYLETTDEVTDFLKRILELKK